MKRIIILLLLLNVNGSILKAQSGFSNSQSSAAMSELLNGAIDAALDVVPGVIDGVNGNNDIPPLSNSECLPDFSESGTIRMSYQCAPESECQECFDNARDKMNFYRRQLGRLNCIYQDIKKFTEASIAFGDGASGVHAMTALAWQKERRGISANFENLKVTYDTRYEEFIEGLRAALMEFDHCENQYGTGDWYAKIGFIYFDMMKERYKRND